MIGGRKAWIAWPAGLACLAVVAGLVWLAAPGLPAAVDFVGNALRTGTDTGSGQPGDTGAAARTPAPTQGAGAEVTDECRSLYPDGLWSQLTWQPHLVLTQSTDPPVTMAASVRDALEPDVVVTCRWRDQDGRAVTTTLARVDAAAADIAGPALSGSGFTCTTVRVQDGAGDGIRCTRQTGAARETDIIRGGLWLATTEAGLKPDGYTDALVRRIWP